MGLLESKLRETLYLISVPGFVESIRAAEKEPDEELIKLEEIDWNV